MYNSQVACPIAGEPATGAITASWHKQLVVQVAARRLAKNLERRVRLAARGHITYIYIYIYMCQYICIYTLCLSLLRDAAASHIRSVIYLYVYLSLHAYFKLWSLKAGIG